MNAAKQLEDAVFFTALNLADLEQRKLFLDQACAGNSELRAAVEELLSAQGNAEHFFSKGASALNLPADEIPAPRFSWRVDGVQWSNPATNQTLRLEELAAGKHRVQVVALDAQLQTGSEPVEILVETRSTPHQHIQKWIAQLGDKDFARREAAMKSLSRQPALALPALRQARERESDPDQRWWLDAAIQECQGN